MTQPMRYIFTGMLIAIPVMLMMKYLPVITANSVTWIAVIGILSAALAALTARLAMQAAHINKIYKQKNASK